MDLHSQIARSVLGLGFLVVLLALLVVVVVGGLWLLVNFAL